MSGWCDDLTQRYTGLTEHVFLRAENEVTSFKILEMLHHYPDPRV